MKTTAILGYRRYPKPGPCGCTDTVTCANHAERAAQEHFDTVAEEEEAVQS